MLAAAGKCIMYCSHYAVFYLGEREGHLSPIWDFKKQHCVPENASGATSDSQPKFPGGGGGGAPTLFYKNTLICPSVKISKSLY